LDGVKHLGPQIILKHLAKPATRERSDVIERIAREEIDVAVLHVVERQATLRQNVLVRAPAQAIGLLASSSRVLWCRYAFDGLSFGRLPELVCGRRHIERAFARRVFDAIRDGRGIDGF
jgi:hypothetical protein